MTPLAEIASFRGYKISGSDQKINSNCERLIASGIQIFKGHEASNLDSQAIVVYSSAIRQDNPELVQAKNSGQTLWHRSQLLEFLIGDQKLIGVSGTHGKTSTTAMIAHILDQCGCQPTAFIGGEVGGRKSYSYTGHGEYFVAELDESDGSFLRFSPFVSVINNIDLDHLDFYKNLEEIKAAFHKFAKQTDPDGAIVLNWDNGHCQELGHEIDLNHRLSFGRRIGCDVRGISFTTKQDASFFKAVVERDLVEGTTPLIGQHNFQNILCALSVVRALEIPIEEAVTALASFPGVKRRLNRLYNSKSIKILDDYAHNPGKIKACIEAVREAYPDHWNTVVFQPHRYSRMKTMYNEFVDSFKDADTLVLLPIFSAGEEDCGSYSPQQFANDIEQQCDTKVVVFDRFPNPEMLLSLVETKDRSVLLSVGAGNVYQASNDLRDFINGQDQKET